MYLTLPHVTSCRSHTFEFSREQFFTKVLSLPHYFFTTCDSSVAHIISQLLTLKCANCEYFKHTWIPVDMYSHTHTPSHPHILTPSHSGEQSIQDVGGRGAGAVLPGCARGGQSYPGTKGNPPSHPHTLTPSHLY